MKMNYYIISMEKLIIRHLFVYLVITHCDSIYYNNKKIK